MKKIICIFLIFLLAVLTCGCGAAKASGTEYALTGVLSDGVEFPAEQAYTNGGRLILYQDGTGELTLGEQTCSFEYTSDSDGMKFALGSIIASCEVTDGTATVTMGDTGLSLIFSRGTAQTTATAEPAEVNLTDAQRQYNGSVSGRMFFDSVEGDWSEYEGRSMALSGTIELDKEGTGKLLLYSAYYSESVPMYTLDVFARENELICTGGYIMKYEISEGAVEIKYEQKDRDDLRTTSFIHPENYIWYVPENTEETEPVIIPVVTVSGRAADSEGNFTFSIELIYS